MVGAGPIELSATSGARVFNPSLIVAIDQMPGRLDAAKQFGADILVNNAEQDPIAAVRDLTAGLGADVAVEAVGVPATFELAVDLVQPAGRIANIGVHGKPATLHLDRLRSRDLTITTGLVDAYSTPTLLPAGQQADQRSALRHPPLRLRRVHRGLRHVLQRSRDRSVEGRPQPELTGSRSAIHRYRP
ncbi:zinc-binding dehydrogenase [Micromonospora sp. NPDC023966]|uniref:zinc-binding dehydrogenase n=1 Tax=Micromonospora sp. NPDC023966 TaxID=3154699 RepID=UPI00340CC0BB